MLYSIASFGPKTKTFNMPSYNQLIMKDGFKQDYKLGIKSGVLAGIIYGVLFSLLMILLFRLYLPQISGQFLEYGIGKQFVYTLYFIIMPLFLIGFSAVAGLVYGVCFTRLINRLPSQNLWVKSIILSIIFWVAIPIPFGMLIVLINPDRSLGVIIASIFYYVLFSLIFSFVYKKLKK